MKTITLNLDDSIVNRFDTLSPEEKSKVEKVLHILLEDIFKKKQNQALSDILDKTAEQAEKNGLTIAKLAELMEWDDQTVVNLFGEEAVRNGR